MSAMTKKVQRTKLSTKAVNDSLPRYLRAIQRIEYKVGRAAIRERNIHHFVEWHGGSPSKLVKERSHTQLAWYLDLGTVS